MRRLLEPAEPTGGDGAAAPANPLPWSCRYDENGKAGLLTELGRCAIPADAAVAVDLARPRCRRLLPERPSATQPARFASRLACAKLAVVKVCREACCWPCCCEADSCARAAARWASLLRRPVRARAFGRIGFEKHGLNIDQLPLRPAPLALQL